MFWSRNALICAVFAAGLSASPTFVNSIVLPGNSIDLHPGSGANLNRLGFFSDIYFNPASNLFYGLADRGAGGGTLSYNTRVEQFSLAVNPATGAISNFNVTRTITFKDANGNPFNGLNPLLLNGSSANLGRSFDPEGFVVAPNGHFFVADEYGPSLYEFNANGTFVRAFERPANLIPKDANGINYTADRSSGLIDGRQDNRGYEGLAISPDGTKLYAVLQDPLVNEGSQNDGRRSTNVRIVEFNTQTGQATNQFIYQLESRSDINARVPGDTFGATNQGRNIGISALIAIDSTRFLVVERDNRGVGVDDPTGSRPIGSKRVYEINIGGATDVSNISLSGLNNLPNGVIAVSKVLHLDIQAALAALGLTIPEKIEGITVGPKLVNGDYLLLIGNDNDFSITQNSSGVQFDVCSGGDQVAIDTPCPAGQTLLPGYLFAFRDSELQGYVSPASVPEPSTFVVSAIGLIGLASLRRRA
ncbi:MAG: esterase-like activity of phytase family protein [Bryobacteraceae bacterium]|nr:esterase-like activity of phytase family protein [Bryobacteraceae bacterium]